MMSLPFTRDAFFDVFAVYNERLWPVALLLWLLTAYATIQLVRARSAKRWFIPALLATHWAWAGTAYHAAFLSTINPAAQLFAALFVIEAGLIVWQGVTNHRLRWSPDRSVRRRLALGIILYSLMYPALAIAEGHTYPRAPTFGVPCPTTMLTIGFLLAADQLPRGLAAIPLVWAAIGGSAAFVLGVRADLMLIVSGVALLTGVIGSRRDETIAPARRVRL